MRTGLSPRSPIKGEGLLWRKGGGRRKKVLMNRLTDIGVE